jgi:RNA polymerase sigma-70 factor (ECF subfamily)
MKANEIERIFRQHYDRMIRLARTMLYDDEESRDVVSEVFAMLVKTDIMPRNIENYLTTSVRNRCLNLLEHKEVRERFEQAYTAEKVSESASQPPLTGETEPVYAERWERLMAYARLNMTGQTLMVFQMRHLQGMKYQEIADQLGISRVMVYKHLTKAMTTIKEYKQNNR